MLLAISSSSFDDASSNDYTESDSSASGSSRRPIRKKIKQNNRTGATTPSRTLIGVDAPSVRMETATVAQHQTARAADSRHPHEDVVSPFLGTNTIGPLRLAAILGRRSLLNTATAAGMLTARIGYMSHAHCSLPRSTVLRGALVPVASTRTVLRMPAALRRLQPA